MAAVSFVLITKFVFSFRRPSLAMSRAQSSRILVERTRTPFLGEMFRPPSLCDRRLVFTLVQHYHLGGLLPPSFPSLTKDAVKDMTPPCKDYEGIFWSVSGDGALPPFFFIGVTVFYQFPFPPPGSVGVVEICAPSFITSSRTRYKTGRALLFCGACPSPFLFSPLFVTFPPLLTNAPDHQGEPCFLFPPLSCFPSVRPFFSVCTRTTRHLPPLPPPTLEGCR